MGEPLCSLCEPSTFRGRADFDVDDCHIFPQGMLTTISIVVSDTGDGLARAGIRCEAGLPLCSVTISPEPKLDLSPSCWSSRVCLELALLSVCVFPFRCTGTFSQEEESAEAGWAWVR